MTEWSKIIFERIIPFLKQVKYDYKLLVLNFIIDLGSMYFCKWNATGWLRMSSLGYESNAPISKLEVSVFIRESRCVRIDPVINLFFKFQMLSLFLHYIQACLCKSIRSTILE